MVGKGTSGILKVMQTAFLVKAYSSTICSRGSSSSFD